MLKLTYSNDPGKLVESLIANSTALTGRGTELLFSPPTIILPNRNLKTWLYFELARRTGVAANIRFQYLEDFVQSILTECGQAGTIINRNIIHSALITLLQKRLTQEDLAKLPAEVSEYLSSSQSSDELDQRIYQLSSQLSRVFEEYFLSRDSMLRKWQRGDFISNKEPFRSTECWQREIWNLLFGSEGSLTNASDSQRRPLLSYMSALDTLPQRTIRLQGEYHLFGFSYMSRGYLRVIDQIVRSKDIHCYSLNPCQEFWEDVASQSEVFRERARRARVNRKVTPDKLEEQEDPFHLDDDAETPALRLWGRPGREYIHILNSMTDCDFNESFADPLQRGQTLLHQLQHDILFREEGRDLPPENVNFSVDQSIRLYACPGIQREVEIVANEIWSLVMQDNQMRGQEADGSHLRFNDIAVIIADSSEYDTYRTHIASVFREIHDIPHSVSDASLAKDARVAEAVQLLLDLPLSAFRREDVLRLLTHPSVIARFPEADPDQWIFWAENTGIFHGRDHTSHSGTYIDKDYYNWEQGIRRLSLGAFMSGLRSGNETVYSSVGEGYLPEEFGLGSMPNAALAISILSSLFEDCRYAADQKMTFGEWSQFLHAFITSYIGADSEDDEQALTECIGIVESLKQRQIDDTRISYRIIREFVRSELSGLTGNKGQYLARGVSVSSFLPMRPIPFRVVFILGLGEGRFPSRDMRNPLDLRGARRMAGDVTARDRDQYMFLETLVSTRDRLCLSYVSRDGQTGDIIEPSSVVKELMFMLERGYVGKDGVKRMIVTHPLRRFDPEYFPSLFECETTRLPNYSPDARKEAAAAALRDSLAREFEGILPEGKNIRQLIPQEVRQFLGDMQPLKAASCDVEELERIPLRIIRKFLECPLQGWAAFQLGLREDDHQDPIVKNEEALETSALDTSIIQRTTFMQSWNQAGTLGGFETIAPAAYEECIRISEMKGQTPSGIFKEAEKRKHLATLLLWHDHLEKDRGSRPVSIVRIQFGKTIGSGASIVESPIVLPQESGTTIEISGSSGLLSADLSAAYILYQKHADKFPTERLLPSFLDMLCLVVLNRVHETVFPVHVVGLDKVKTYKFNVPPRDICLEFLQTAVNDITKLPHAYLLPHDVVIKWHFDNKKHSLETLIAEAKGDDRKSRSCSYGPLRAGDYDPPWRADAEDLAERRLGLFLDSLVLEKKEAKLAKKGKK